MNLDATHLRTPIKCTSGLVWHAHKGNQAEVVDEPKAVSQGLYICYIGGTTLLLNLTLHGLCNRSRRKAQFNLQFVV